jgi:hypothetical protein
MGVVLSDEAIEHFLARGHVVVPNAVPAAVVERFRAAAWARTGYDPSDPSTWQQQFLRLEPTMGAPMETEAPLAFGAICDLVGGAERLDVATLTDTMIMNLGAAGRGGMTEWMPPLETARAGKGGWHKDGWHFKHFLDTPDQALLATVLFTDVVPGAGGTYIAADSAKHVARWFAEHPEGSQGLPGDETKRIIAACEDFVELTGSAGDLVLMHPMTLHTVSVNPTDRPRLITNPAPTLKQPMRFDRAVFEEHSIVEQYILNALGTRSFAFQPTTARESNFVPGGFQGEGEQELGELLAQLGVTWAAAGSDLRNTLPLAPAADEQQEQRAKL